MKPSLTTGVTFPEYQRLRGVSWSALQHMRTSPLDYRENLMCPKVPTPIMELGSALHMIILEPDLFAATYAVFEGRRGTKAHSDWMDEHPLMSPLTPEQWEQCEGAAHAVHKAIQGRQARRVLRVCEREVSLRWTDPRTRTICKARPDLVGPGVLADLKTTGSIDEHTFSRLAGDMGYHGKMAFASMGLDALGKYPDVVYIIAVEQKRPYDVAVFELDEATRDRAERDVCHYLRMLQECRRRRRWPGRYQNVVRLDIGEWEFEPEALEDIDITGVGLQLVPKGA